MSDLMNVSAFKGMVPDAAFSSLDPKAESLADGIGSSYGIVSYRGKVWSLRLRGATHTFVRPDDGSPAPFLDVIVLRSPPYKSKSYYPANSYQEGSSASPTCASLHGEFPDAEIATPQNVSCAGCPRNEFKTLPDGRKHRDCADYKRLAVLILPNQTKALLGAPLMEPVFLRIPRPRSMNSPCSARACRQTASISPLHHEDRVRSRGGHPKDDLPCPAGADRSRGTNRASDA